MSEAMREDLRQALYADRPSGWLNFHRPLVRAILEHPYAFDWTLQGLGMLRTYLSPEVRMHVWDAEYRVPGVSMMHTHPWDFESLIVAGVVHQNRYRAHDYIGGDTTFEPECGFYWRQSLKCGVGGGLESKPERIILHEQPIEVYYAGATYRQEANEIHVSQPADGTVTLIARHFHPDTEHAYVYWRQDKGIDGWVSAEPREATPAEVRRICGRALDRWFG